MKQRYGKMFKVGHAPPNDKHLSKDRFKIGDEIVFLQQG